MTGRTDIVFRQPHGTVGFDDEGGADDTLDDLAVVLLLPEGTPGGHDRLILIGEQREVEIMVITELRQFVHRSGEMPRTLTPRSLSWARESRKSQASFVHPGVLALG